MMLSYSLSSSSSSSPPLPRLILTAHHHPPPSVNFPTSIGPILQVGRRRRGVSVVTRAGPSYVIALVLPLSLLAITVFTSVRIADKLDQKFLEELAVNQAILEEEEEKEKGDEVSISLEKEATPIRRRNRPKREVERSST